MSSFLQRTITNWLLVLFFLSLFIFEYIVFKQNAIQYIIYNYPNLFDQGGYLASLYNHNKPIFFSNLKDLWALLPTGPLFMVQSFLIMKIFGATRLTLLTVNLVYFMLLQFVVFATIKRVTQSIILGLLALALLLSLQYPFFTAGGLYDFRIDFIAFCCLGLYACFILQSNIFLKTRTSL